MKKLLHWYGEWTPNGDESSSAACLRDGCQHTGTAKCENFSYLLLMADDERCTFVLCPICGAVSDDARLERVEDAAAEAETLPPGELILRLGELQNGERLLSVGFETGGLLTQPTVSVQIMLPAALVEGYALSIIAEDGTETELPVTVLDEIASFTLEFDAEDELPARVIRLVPVP